MLANAVPGAVGGDLLKPGSTQDIVVGGLVTTFTLNLYMSHKQSQDEKAVREIYFKFPYLGFGLGYAAMRIGGQDPLNAAMVGALLAIVAMYWRKKLYKHAASKPLLQEEARTSKHTNSGVVGYQAVNKDPQVAPAGQGFPRTDGRPIQRIYIPK